MIRRPPRSTLSSSSAASDVYKRQHYANKHVSLVQCSGISLALSNHGTLSITHNTMQVPGVIVIDEWLLQIVYMERAPLTVSGSSTLSISHNNVLSLIHI
eukprot:TRINITY_DN58749_c0_g1_i2.p1 TRINITY_DN58749_c0_g1~~TRINITY_DN58749_c0_g1_i2.p1  ORF type:complete len:100 (+),score=28.78 TRINITY_DN58749_c0_g1_i2:128-427(+)